MAPKGKILVAMSGGVDSSAACILLKEQGYDVVGVTLLLKGEIDEVSAKSIADAADKLGIEHHYLDCRDDFFQRVILPSALEYSCGRTPNPCCICNPAMKFAAVSAFADSLGIEKIATGHYAATVESDGCFYLKRGADKFKDQSYFLYRLSGSLLARLIFPLADKNKDEIRTITKDAGLEVFDRPDSQDVCFAVPGECCGETLRRLVAMPERPGNFIYNGKVVGRHPGVHLYTIGQRKGLGVALGKPAYISRINSRSGDIELVTDESIITVTSFSVDNAVWNCPVLPENIPELSVKIRYRTTDCPCQVTRCGDVWQVSSPSGVFRAVTPGQSAVFYWHERLLGGGIIRESDPVKC